MPPIDEAINTGLNMDKFKSFYEGETKFNSEPPSSSYNDNIYWYLPTSNPIIQI